MSNLLALIANCHRDPKRKPTPYKADDFNPFTAAAYTRGAGIPINKESMNALAKAFTGKTFDDVQPPPPLNLPELQWPK